MIEPTESENLEELDRFCDAMIAIRDEIAEVEAGRMPVAQSPLRHAPHTARDLIDDGWARAYPRSAAMPSAGSPSRAPKYWPPVGRIDNGYGDRNLICACAPIEHYAEAAE